MQKVKCETATFCCPVPRGTGGLKCYQFNGRFTECRSRPARDGWIEIRLLLVPDETGKSRPARDGWIEIRKRQTDNPPVLSRPARDGWIEIWTRYTG